MRQATLELLRDYILTAHSISPVGWVVYQFTGGLAFLIWQSYTLEVGADLSGSRFQGIIAFVDKEALSETDRQELSGMGCSITSGFKSLPHGVSVRIPFGDPKNYLAAIEIVRRTFPDYLQKSLHPGMRTTQFRKYGPAVVEFLRRTFGPEIPHPDYYGQQQTTHASNAHGKGFSNLLSLMQSALQANGYSFTLEQIAAFYTALQTKGFVILTGISGTGKTKLAQQFSRLLPNPHKLALVGALREPLGDNEIPREQARADYWTYPIRQDISEDLRLPFNLYLYYDGRVEEAYHITDFRTRARQDAGMETPWPEITRPELLGKRHEDGKPNKQFKTWMKASHRYKLPEALPYSKFKQLYGFSSEPVALKGAFVPVIDPQESDSNTFFLSVRLDWRDGKVMLGYYNPLNQEYEWTEFLHFLLKAVRDYQTRGAQANAWFLILDEMNLARVEYYFADFLSVLESGRSEDGWTVEAIRLAYPDDCTGSPPPKKIQLPPNLYVIGTVNVDETTHAFSPKVLDRAFTIELTQVDFTDYSPEPGQTEMNVSDEQRKEMLRGFARDGKFHGVDKEQVATYVDRHPEVRARLQSLNTLLQPYELHFGFRVFDEIIAFLDNAETSGVYGSIGGLDAPFDAAVLMKVLPKFHGSRGRLEKPLQAILAWCRNPDQPDVPSIQQLVQQQDDGSVTNFSNQAYLYPRTANRVIRLLERLYTTGFAAFG